jgi:hypothetical protein
VSPGLPSEDELVAERAAEDRFERWLLVRQLAIIFVLVALIVTHGLLAHGVFG